MDIRSIDLTIDYGMFYDELRNAMTESKIFPREAKISYEEQTKIIKQLKELMVEHEMDPNKFINVHFRVKAHEFD